MKKVVCSLTNKYSKGFLLLEEIINADIINEENPFYDKSVKALKKNNDSEILSILDELINNASIDKSYPDYKAIKSVVKKRLFEGGSPYEKGTGWYEEPIEEEIIDEDEVISILKDEYGYGDIGDQLHYFMESSFYKNPKSPDEFAEQMDEYLKSDENNYSEGGAIPNGLIEARIKLLKKMNAKNPSPLLKARIKLLEKMAKKKPDQPKKYKLGDKYSEDFDYKGMLEYGWGVDLTSSIEKLEKLSDSFEDVNYREINKPLNTAISFLNHGEREKAEPYLVEFQDLCRKELEPEEEPKPKPEPDPKYKVGDILMHKDLGKSYKVKILAVTGWTGTEHRYDIEFVNDNNEGLGKFAKSYDEVLSEVPIPDENKAHYLVDGDLIYVDSNFLNYSKGKIPNSELEHLGFGDFHLKTPAGDINFIRKEEKIEGFVGRVHELAGDTDNIKKLIDAMKKNGVLVEIKSSKPEPKPGPSGDVFANPERFIKYGSEFLYPPRAEEKVRPTAFMFSKLDNGTFIAQPKLNGSAASVTISEKTVVAKERHGSLFSVPPEFDFLALHRGKGGAMCLTGEFMNKSKKDEEGKPFRGFCIWDITAYEDNILVGSTIEERIKLLEQLYPSKGVIKTKNGTDLLYKTEVPDVYRVANFSLGFEKLFNELSQIDMIEGFVCKRKTGRLEMMTSESNNKGWQIKARKPSANYEH